MERFTSAQMDEDVDLRSAWAAAARVTPGVSVPGSAPDWGLAAHVALHGGEREATWWHEDGHWVALARGPWEGLGTMVQALEAAWGFACPVVGTDPEGAGLRLLRRALVEVAPGAGGVLLSGIPRGSALEAGVRALLRHRYGRRWTVLPGTDEVVADLSGGMDAWWQRRTARFRANLRAAGRRAKAAGLRLECFTGGDPQLGDGEGAFARLLAADARTWKAAAGESVFQDAAHAAFYRNLIQRTARDGRLWVAFAVSPEGTDAGYLVGYREGDHFRGLQLGYDPAWAACSPGHLLQERVLAELVRAGVQTYNLGMEIGYKSRWADRRIGLVQLVGLGQWAPGMPA